MEIFLATSLQVSFLVRIHRLNVLKKLGLATQKNGQVVPMSLLDMKLARKRAAASSIREIDLWKQLGVFIPVVLLLVVYSTVVIIISTDSELTSFELNGPLTFTLRTVTVVSIARVTKGLRDSYYVVREMQVAGMIIAVDIAFHMWFKLGGMNIVGFVFPHYFDITCLFALHIGTMVVWTIMSFKNSFNKYVKISESQTKRSQVAPVTTPSATTPRDQGKGLQGKKSKATGLRNPAGLAVAVPNDNGGNDLKKLSSDVAIPLHKRRASKAGRTLDGIMSHPLKRAHFQRFLIMDFSAERLMFWLEAASWSEYQLPSVRYQNALAIFNEYMCGLNSKWDIHVPSEEVIRVSTFISEANKVEEGLIAQHASISEMEEPYGDLPDDLFLTSMEIVWQQLEHESLPRFLLSIENKELDKYLANHPSQEHIEYSPRGHTDFARMSAKFGKNGFVSRSPSSIGVRDT